MANRLVVIEPQYCVPHQVELKVMKKKHCIKGVTLYFLYDNSHLCKVKAKFFNLHQRRVLLDTAGKPVVNLKEKIGTMHRRWKVYRGEISDLQYPLFSVIKPDEQQVKPVLHVFLASNTNEDVVDFRIEGSWSAGSFAIYIGRFGSTPVAELLPNTSVVTVYPNIDCAFIVTLADILYQIFEGDDGSAPALLKAFGTGFVKGALGNPF